MSSALLPKPEFVESNKKILDQPQAAATSLAGRKTVLKIHASPSNTVYSGYVFFESVHRFFGDIRRTMAGMFSNNRTFSFIETVESFQDLQRDWNGVGSEPPNSLAIELARIILLDTTGKVSPSKVVPSAEGGVGICFVRGQRYADIEILNTGEIVGTMSRDSKMPEIWEIKPGQISSEIKTIRDFINS